MIITSLSVSVKLLLDLILQIVFIFLKQKKTISLQFGEPRSIWIKSILLHNSKRYITNSWQTFCCDNNNNKYKIEIIAPIVEKKNAFVAIHTYKFSRIDRRHLPSYCWNFIHDDNKIVFTLDCYELLLSYRIVHGRRIIIYYYCVTPTWCVR